MKFKYLAFLIAMVINGVIRVKAHEDKIPEISISAISKNEKSDLVFRTKAYVIFVYGCPPCPATDVCKPCMRENVVISEKPDIIKNYTNPDDKAMIIYTRSPISVELGKRYEFALKLISGDVTHDQKKWRSANMISLTKID